MSDKPLTYLKPPPPSACYRGCREGCGCEQPVKLEEFVTLDGEPISLVKAVDPGWLKDFRTRLFADFEADIAAAQPEDERIHPTSGRLLGASPIRTAKSGRASETERDIMRRLNGLTTCPKCKALTVRGEGCTSCAGIAAAKRLAAESALPVGGVGKAKETAQVSQPCTNCHKHCDFFPVYDHEKGFCSVSCAEAVYPIWSVQ